MCNRACLHGNARLLMTTCNTHAERANYEIAKMR